MLEDAEAVPLFTPIIPSLENISDLLSIIGAHANVIKVTKETVLERSDFLGFIGFGSIDKIFSYASPIEGEGLLRLDSMKDGEISFAIVNIVYPDGFSDAETATSLSRVDVLQQAAFAQDFISKIEVKRKNDSCPSVSQCFAIVFFGKEVYLLSGSGCWDETKFFERNIWSESKDGRIVTDFKVVLKDQHFKEANGRLFAVVADRKLLIKKELDVLQKKYSDKYGNYNNDKTMSKEDWANVSALNATISEAETFELVIEGPRGQRLSDGNTSHDTTNLSADEERYDLFSKIRETERKLWAEQERFKYSMVPGCDVAEARKEFFRKVGNAKHNFEQLPLSRTPLVSNTRYNLTHRRCFSAGSGQQKMKRKSPIQACSSVTPKRKRVRI